MSINVTRSSMPSFEAFCDEIRPLWESRWLTNQGLKHQALEEALKAFLDAPYLTLFVNGHQALEGILRAMDLEGEVITTPFTYASTTHAITRTGLKPVFCDVRPDNLTLDPALIEPLITDKTCAILPVHVYGNLCDVDAIKLIADRYQLKVIYDAAHVFGVRKGEKNVAAFGDASMLSFHATKVFHSIEGGAVIYHDPTLVDRLNAEKCFGLDDFEYSGGNSKMNEFQAAMGLCNLRIIQDEINKRAVVAERYMANLKDIDGLTCWTPEKDITPNYAYFPVLFGADRFGLTRDEVSDLLAQEDIYARKYFYPLTSAFPCYVGKIDPGYTPVAEKAAADVLCLPMYADLDIHDVDLICDLIIQAKRS